jgi:hypothetical protein
MFSTNPSTQHPMKKSILTSLTVSAFLALVASRAFAHPNGHETDPMPAPPPPAHGHEHTTKVPASAAAIMEEIQKQQALLIKTVDDKKLEDAHDYAFAIRDMVQALVTKVPEAKKKDVEVAAGKIAQVAADIEKSAAAGAQKTTEANVKSMGGALKTLKLILPHDHS